MSLLISSLTHAICDGSTQRKLLVDINLAIAAGECVALMGDSGSGKTTLLNLIAGLEPIQQGEITIAECLLSNANDQQLSHLRKQHLGIIFQQFNLLSSLSVQDNIDFSAKLANRYNAENSLKLAQQLGIEHLLTKYPTTLSGGEMQRVAIARALNSQPKLLLADEPTGNLDDRNSQQVVAELIRLAKANNTALLMVTHSSKVAASMDKIYQLKDNGISLTTNTSAISATD